MNFMFSFVFFNAIDVLFCSQELVKQVLSAIKSVAGNDDVKDAVVSAGGVPLIVMAMNRHLTNASVGLVSKLSLPFIEQRTFNKEAILHSDQPAINSIVYFLPCSILMQFKSRKHFNTSSLSLKVFAALLL